MVIHVNGRNVNSLEKEFGQKENGNFADDKMERSVVNSHTCQDKQKSADENIQFAAHFLGITEITDCDSSISYVMKEFDMTELDFCNSVEIELLEIVPGDQWKKD